MTATTPCIPHPERPATADPANLTRWVPRPVTCDLPHVKSWERWLTMSAHNLSMQATSRTQVETMCRKERVQARGAFQWVSACAGSVDIAPEWAFAGNC
jgi:hypothetical protein